MSSVKYITENFGKYDVFSIESYMNIGGFSALKKAITMDKEDIASLLTEAKIKGRGGAAYPMGRKWSQARAVERPHHCVICNADEGETCTFKDRELIKLVCQCPLLYRKFFQISIHNKDLLFCRANYQ